MKNGKKDAQASWGGRFSKGPSELMLRFSESVSFDRLLAEFDIQGSVCASILACATGIISKRESAQIVAGLSKILCRAPPTPRPPSPPPC